MSEKTHSVKKHIFRDEVRDFVERRLGHSIDKLNDFQRSQWMTRAYLETILRKLNPGLVPDDSEDFEASFADGPSDAAVDFLVRAEGHVLIIQTKYHARGKTEKEHDFNHFCDVLSRLNPELGKKYKVSEKVRELASDINWETDTFELQFITLASANDNIRARESAGQQQVKELPGIEDRVDVIFYDESDLNQRLREADSAGERIAEPVVIRFSGQKAAPPWITYESSDGRISYIGYVKAAEFRNLYAKHRYRLFAQNIRNYVGDTSTNKGIIKTALDEPDNFFFFNNGIAAVASKIEPSTEKGEIRCEQFSVINGAQTVRSLAKAHTRNPASSSGAAVLLRLSQVSFKHDTSEESFLDNVTRYNNTQNAVKVSDFRSNDDVQRALAKKFSGLSRGGKQYWYKNKRTGEPDSRKISIGMEEFAKTVFAFQFGPSDMFGGTSHLFDIGARGGYAKVFGDDDGQVWSTVNDVQFNFLAGIWFLCEKVREELKEEKSRLAEGAKDDDAAVVRYALERRWLVFFTVGEWLRKRYELEKADLKTEIARLAKPKWLDDQGDRVTQIIGRYTCLACETLVKVYRSAKKSATFAHRNWFRSQDTLKEISTEIRFSTTVLDTLALLKAN